MADDSQNLLSTLQAPGSTPNFISPDVQSALTNTQAGSVAPGLEQGMQQFPQGQPQGLLPDSSFLQNQYKELFDEFRNIGQPTKAEQDFARIAAYTPQQRAQDIYNNMFGISKIPQYDPTNRDPNQQPTGMQTKVDWKRYIPSVLSEMARAFVQKGDYVPARERANQTALQQYNAEVGPVTREVMYDSMNRRAALKDSVSLLNNLALNSAREHANNIKQEIADNAKYLNPARKALYEARIDNILGNTPPAQQKMELDKVRSQALQETSALREAQTALTKQKTQGLQSTGGIPGALGQEQAQIAYFESIGNKQAADSIRQTIAARNANLQMKNTSVQMDSQGRPIQVTKSPNGPIVSQPGSGPGTQQVPGQAPPPPPNLKDITAYYRNAPVDMNTNLQFRDDLPAGTDPTTRDIIHHAPIAFKVPPKSQNEVTAAFRGEDAVTQMYSLLRQFSPSDLSNLRGKFTQLASKYADPSSWTTTPADKFNSFAQLAQIVGFNHAVTMGSRNSNFVRDVANAIDNLAHNKKQLAADIFPYEGSFLQNLQQNQWAKTNPATKNMSSEQIVRAFHPELYNKIYKKGEVGPPNMDSQYVSAADLIKELQNKKGK